MYQIYFNERKIGKVLPKTMWPIYLSMYLAVKLLHSYLGNEKSGCHMVEPCPEYVLSTGQDGTLGYMNVASLLKELPS